VSNSNYYINNTDILRELKEYRKTGKMSEKLGEYVMMIAKNLSSKGSFSGYSWKDDMCSEAVLTCVKYLHNFDPEKSNNPFAYITACCKNAFISYIKAQNKHGEIKNILYNINGGKQIIVDSTCSIQYNEYRL
jgi:DNA-directed RNA polymerase specialized sigma subunit